MMLSLRFAMKENKKSMAGALREGLLDVGGYRKENFIRSDH
jgi:hypothetical protein